MAISRKDSTMMINHVFDLKNCEPFFSKEKVEVTRWDKIDAEVIRHMFENEPIKRDVASFLNYFVNYSDTNDQYRKLGRFLYPAGNFEVLVSFLRLAFNQQDCQMRINCLMQALEQDNCYSDPPWILWKRFLTDVFDVLNQWRRCDEKKLDCIIRNF